MKPYIYVAMSLVVVMSVTGCKKKPQEQPPAVTVEVSDSQELDFKLLDQSGKEVTLSDYNGKIVILEWLNYDCPFVKPRYENKTFQDTAKKYAAKDIVWIGINSTHYATVQTNKEFADKHEVPYAILDDHSGETGRLFSATNTPQFVILNKDAEIVYNGAFDNAHRGTVPSDGHEKYLETVIDEMLAGKPVSISNTKPVGCTVKYAK